ncbi:hypothetical protein DUI87_00316 [Hirundo rustica rustica]|uniref:Uncharacterized protein n=1 Tax=Hirundo rustica rustica TaxID=333673 RepID=A0A3M0LF90_HIRRU|nr:hypothetical protein DUI87_00316 [Hirundo rustica rustica]
MGSRRNGKIPNSGFLKEQGNKSWDQGEMEKCSPRLWFLEEHGNKIKIPAGAWKQELGSRRNGKMSSETLDYWRSVGTRAGIKEKLKNPKIWIPTGAWEQELGSRRNGKMSSQTLDSCRNMETRAGIKEKLKNVFIDSGSLEERGNKSWDQRETQKSPTLDSSRNMEKEPGSNRNSKIPSLQGKRIQTRMESFQNIPGPEGAPGELQRGWGQGTGHREWSGIGKGEIWDLGKEFLPGLQFPENPWSVQGRVGGIPGSREGSPARDLGTCSSKVGTSPIPEHRTRGFGENEDQGFRENRIRDLGRTGSGI